MAPKLPTDEKRRDGPQVIKDKSTFNPEPGQSRPEIKAIKKKR